MKKKKSRNKFRDLLADYYLTNREITKHYDREHEKRKDEGSPWKSSEKTMIIITVIALVLLISKYLMKIL